MNKMHKIWTVVTPEVHSVLKDIYHETDTVMTKTILDIIFNKLPEKLEEDYSFTTRGGKMIVISVTQKEKGFIEELAKKEKCKVSRLLRNIIYTHFKRESLIQ
jgi:hypothetical protein